MSPVLALPTTPRISAKIPATPGDPLTAVTSVSAWAMIVILAGSSRMIHRARKSMSSIRDPARAGNCLSGEQLIFQSSSTFSPMR